MTIKSGFCSLQIRNEVRDFLKYKVAMDLTNGVKSNICDLIKDAVYNKYADELKTYRKLVKSNKKESKNV